MAGATRRNFEPGRAGHMPRCPGDGSVHRRILREHSWEGNRLPDVDTSNGHVVWSNPVRNAFDLAGALGAART